ncbi:MAG TPA: phospho-N-acetylmuramoyl-pentapeptide-transferase [Mycobacteriales bacterium]|nr:phospho-N-acetylmuramoyl-pentapeptide-transferase [Mycobacteriales bacterium]
MRDILVAAMGSLIVSLVGTPLAIRLFRSRGYGQLIREDGPTSHHTKRGTPTMGGTVIIAATISGYTVAHLVLLSGPTASAVLVLFLMTGLGLVGFLDDYIKIRKQRSLGLNKTTKLVGQAVVAVVFGVLALHFPGGGLVHLTPVSSHLSFVRDYPGLVLGTVGFVIWAYLMVSATSNGVNLTDGLDGLASGAAVMVFAAYVVISFWEFKNGCGSAPGPGCYHVRDPLDLATVASAAMGACFGFLWWNASPARVFMGDTGSLALGGTLAGLAMTTRTELLLVILGGLFVVETLSVIIQVVAFRGFRRRVFNMAPVHHHFELGGWNENTVIVRFWIIAGLAVAFGLGVFYAEFLSRGPLR